MSNSEDLKFNTTTYEIYLKRFLSEIPKILIEGAEEFFKSTYSNIEKSEILDIKFIIQRKQILWIFAQLNNILDKEIISGIKKDKNDEHCLREFTKLCEEANLALHSNNYNADRLYGKVIKEFNNFCGDDNFLKLYDKITKYVNDIENFI